MITKQNDKLKKWEYHAKAYMKKRLAVGRFFALCCFVLISETNIEQIKRKKIRITHDS